MLKKLCLDVGGQYLEEFKVYASSLTRFTSRAQKSKFAASVCEPTSTLCSHVPIVFGCDDPVTFSNIITMPKILARDPVWLSTPTPGFNLFQPDNDSKAKKLPDTRYEGPLRKVAHRGTEVIVAVGNELRWSELGLLKDAGEDYERRHGNRYDGRRHQEEQGERAYRVREH